MIIELYGPAGSGKTTLANYVKQNYHWPVIAVFGKRELLALNAFFLFKYFFKFFRRLTYVFSNFVNLKLFYYKLMNAFMQQNAKRIKAEKLAEKRQQAIIIDQGIIQSAVSMFEKKISREQMQKYLQAGVLPDILVIFEAPEGVLKQRIGVRGYFIRQFMPPDYLAAFKGISEHNNQVLNQCLDGVPMRVLRVNAEEKIEVIAAKLKDFLNKLSIL